MADTTHERDQSEFVLDECEENACPLSLAPVGQELRLCQLCTGRRVARRLAELGLTPGVSLRVVQEAGGPLLVSVRNSRVALGRGLTDKLQVQVLDSEHTADKEADLVQESDDSENSGGWWRGRGWRGNGHGRRRRSHGNGHHWNQR